MTNNVLCDEFAERLADLFERDVDEPTRAALEAHALSCDECGSLLADIRKLRIDASNLPVLAPARDLWAGVAERIDAPVIPLRGARGDRSNVVRHWRRWGSLAAAAVVLVAVTSLATRYLTVQSQRSAATSVAVRPSSDSVTTSAVASRPIDTVPSGNAASEPSSVRPEPASSRNPARLANNAAKPSAEQVYASEIARLHAIVEQRRSQLDPVTVSVIERNLKVIDDAIAQCKVALGKDPASRFLMESLNNALETKVELLRTAALLPTRS
jgi:hypothetical protein